MIALSALLVMVVPATADAHVLTKNRARNATIDALRAAAQANPTQIFVVGVGPANSACKRFGDHKVACLALYRYDPNPSDPSVPIQNCSRRVVITMSSRSSALKPKKFFGGGCG